MNTELARKMFELARKECERRASNANERPEYGEDWLLVDEPFVNEICLVILVGVYHQLEREIVLLGARVLPGKTILSRVDYETGVKRIKTALLARQHEGWKELIKSLELADRPEWQSLQTLRLIANGYKHDPFGSISDDVLSQLGLSRTISDSPRVTYAGITDSLEFRDRLARYLDLDAGSDFCDIGEEFLGRAERFIDGIEKLPQVCRIASSRFSRTEFVG